MIECSSKNEKNRYMQTVLTRFSLERHYISFSSSWSFINTIKFKKKSCLYIESLILFTAIISSLLRVKDVSKFRFYIISYEMRHFTKKGNNNPLRI